MSTSSSSRPTASETCSGTSRDAHPRYSQVVELDLGGGRAVAGRPAPAAGPGAARAAHASPSSRRSAASASTTIRRGARRDVPGERPHDRAGPAGHACPIGRRRTPRPHSRGGRGVRVDRSTARSVELGDGDGRDRRDHLVHQHLEPPGDDRAPGCSPRRRSSAACAAGPWVKTSLAPGLARRQRLLRPLPASSRYLDELGFNTVGYGCTTCIGNSGPLRPEVADAMGDGDLVTCAVLSGNRNFEARIHPDVKANYLASPPLVVAYALAGRIDIDLERDPLGATPDGDDVFLAELWPSSAEIEATIAASVRGGDVLRDLPRRVHAATRPGGGSTRPRAPLYAWDAASTYIRRPPYFDGMPPEPARGRAMSTGRAASSRSATRSRPTTSRPAGSIRLDSPAGALPDRARRRAGRLQLLRRRGAATTR